MKDVVKLEHYYFPWELEKAIADWVDHYNHDRYRESLDNVTSADAFERQAKRESRSAGSGDGQDHDPQVKTKPAISRQNWISNWQKHVS